jgi:phosphohistidine phosphatase
MLLYLLRHGDAAQSGMTDSVRPLSPFGEEQAVSVARTVAALPLPPTIILASPLRRAVQTAEAVRRSLPEAGYLLSEYLVPGNDERQLFAQLNGLPAEAALLIGHEPQLRRVASVLLSGTPHLRIELRTGTLLCLDCSRGIGPGLGVLRWMLTFDQMSRPGGDAGGPATRSSRGE